jgi:hypothetical protein
VRSRREDFFFEKKKQKTFAPALLPPDALLLGLARHQKSKSFLVPFFKKEHFPASFAAFARREGGGLKPTLRA